MMMTALTHARHSLWHHLWRRFAGGGHAMSTATWRERRGLLYVKEAFPGDSMW